MTDSSGTWPWLRRALLGIVPLVVALASPAFATALEQKLIAPEGTAGDLFGASVALDGDTAVVGAPNEDAAYVFTRSGDTWSRTGKLTASDGADSSLGQAVAIDGDTIVVAAPGAGGGGALYTFARTGPAARGQTAKLTVSNAAVETGLGASVAIDGETIVAGSSKPNVYTFARNGAAQRNETASLFASDLGGGGGGGEVTGTIGRSVAIDGDTIVAGAPRDAPAGSESGFVGAVYTFATTGDPQRTETAKLTASNPELSMLGLAVAIDGDTIVAAAPVSSLGPDLNGGSVYTFARTGAATRTETGRLTASDGAEGDTLGFSVAISGNRIVAGAPSDDVDAKTDQGSVYEFARSGAAQRTETATLTASDGAADDGLGASVAVEGATVIAGASSDDVGPSADEGSASIFFAATPPPPPPPPPPGAMCAGRAATIVADADQTVVNGTPGDDVIVGSDANDTIDGRGGDDVICAGKGDDRVQGGRGADNLRGDSGDDDVRGDRGDDAVRGGTGDDALRGGSGDDDLRGAAGADDVRGGANRDRVDGGSGPDRMFGGSGADELRAIDATRDRVDCGTGRDDARVDTRDRLKRCERVHVRGSAGAQS